jgi:hypothetical protein
METKSFSFPTFIVRSKPGSVRKQIAKQLGIKFNEYSFGRNREKGQRILEEQLLLNRPTGAQCDFFYMNYMPEWQRVHINVHFVVIIGKDGNEYIISDSYHPKIAKLDEQTFMTARFAGGHMAPKGFMFNVKKIPQDIDFRKAIVKGIKKACFNMLKLPIPFIGIKGIYKFADKVKTWPDLARDTEHLSHEIMKINVLLEDQGTGGAGFRYMYAAFLQEASKIMQDEKLDEFSKEIMNIGDKWREISYFSAKIGKKRDFSENNINQLSDMIREKGDLELNFFNNLYKYVKKIKI